MGILNDLFAESKSRGLKQYSCQTLVVPTRRTASGQWHQVDKKNCYNMFNFSENRRLHVTSQNKGMTFWGLLRNFPTCPTTWILSLCKFPPSFKQEEASSCRALPKGTSAEQRGSRFEWESSRHRGIWPGDQHNTREETPAMDYWRDTPLPSSPHSLNFSFISSFFLNFWQCCWRWRQARPQSQFSALSQFTLTIHLQVTGCSQEDSQ